MVNKDAPATGWGGRVRGDQCGRWRGGAWTWKWTCPPTLRWSWAGWRASASAKRSAGRTRACGARMDIGSGTGKRACVWGKRGRAGGRAGRGSGRGRGKKARQEGRVRRGGVTKKRLHVPGGSTGRAGDTRRHETRSVSGSHRAHQRRAGRAARAAAARRACSAAARAGSGAGEGGLGGKGRGGRTHSRLRQGVRLLWWSRDGPRRGSSARRMGSTQLVVCESSITLFADTISRVRSDMAGARQRPAEQPRRLRQLLLALLGGPLDELEFRCVC